MKTYSRFGWVTLLLISVALVLACNVVAPPAPDNGTQTQPSPEATSTELEASATPQVEATLEPTVAPTDSPSCTILQDLFFRSGPGTAYNPPIASFPTNTVVIPLGYNPVGTPGGSWIQVQDPASQKKGWISGGSAFVSCNIDLTKLSEVAVDPPPPPQRPHAEGSNTDGTCGQGGILGQDGVTTYDCKVVYSGDHLLEARIFKDGQRIGKSEGVQSVLFTVKRDDNTIYTRTETKEAYCIFGGDDHCNPWVLEDNVYKWESGGETVEPGDYVISVDATTDDPTINIRWQEDVQITLP